MCVGGVEVVCVLRCMYVGGALLGGGQVVCVEVCVMGGGGGTGFLVPFISKCLQLPGDCAKNPQKM